MIDTMRKQKGSANDSSKRTLAMYLMAALACMLATVSGSCSVSDERIKTLKPELPQFDHVGRFVDGVAPVRKGVTWAYADESGKTITKFIYEKAEPFAEGLAAVQKNGKWGYIDRSGILVIEPRFDSAGESSESLASVSLPIGSDSKYGYIDRKGAFVIKPQYDFALMFYNGVANVVRKKADGSTKEGAIDKSGTVIVPIRFDDLRLFSEGLAAAQLEGRWGFIDKTGKVVIPTKFDDAWSFHNGLAPVRQNKWGFIDKKGNIVITPRFDDIAFSSPQPFERGVAKVKSSEGWGCITINGEGVECPSR